LIKEGIINEEQIAALDAEAKAETAAAVEFAEASPLPNPADIQADVYFEVDRQTPAGRTGKHFFND
jgi:pyruvate dehydrogenase E1 component alpha subunit